MGDIFTEPLRGDRIIDHSHSARHDLTRYLPDGKVPQITGRSWERKKQIRFRTLIEVVFLAGVVLTILVGIRLKWLKRLWARVQLALWVYVALILGLAAAWAIREALIRP